MAGLSMQLSMMDSLFAYPMIVRSIPELGRASLQLPSIHFAGMFTHPSLQNTSLHGTSHSEILEWLDTQADNARKVLYVAMGSELTGALDETTLAEMHDALKSIQKQHAALSVLWVAKGKNFNASSMPTAMKIVSFAPQQAVLEHHACIAFLSHAGANSIHESLAAGKPMILLPYLGDQQANAATLVELGAGTLMSTGNISKAAIHVAVADVLLPERTTAAQHLGSMLLSGSGFGGALQVIKRAAARDPLLQASVLRRFRPGAFVETLVLDPLMVIVAVGVAWGTARLVREGRRTRLSKPELKSA